MSPGSTGELTEGEPDPYPLDDGRLCQGTHRDNVSVDYPTPGAKGGQSQVQGSTGFEVSGFGWVSLVPSRPVFLFLCFVGSDLQTSDSDPGLPGDISVEEHTVVARSARE